MNNTGEDRVVRVPADVELADHVLGRLTGRQLVIISTGCLLAWCLFTAIRHTFGWQMAAGGALSVVAAALVLALGRMEGMSLDRLVGAAIAQAAAANRLVPAPDGVEGPPSFVAADRAGGSTRLPAPLRLPGHAVSSDGVVTLGAEGFALLMACDTVCFGLRTESEQDALTAAFGRWLNGLSGPVQILVRAHRIDLGRRIAGLREAAPGLPHPHLEAAARAHAEYLAGIGEHRELLTHEVLLVLRERSGTPTRRLRPAEAATLLARRADDARQALRAAGVTARVLSADEVWQAVAGSTDPGGRRYPGRRAVDGDVITGRSSPSADHRRSARARPGGAPC